jgi:hypothetical protein
MSLSQAAKALTIWDAALEYWESGLSVIPIPLQDKKARIDWKRYQYTRATGVQMNRWNIANEWGNVAIICGFVSRNLVVIDLDGTGAIEKFSHNFPHWLNTYTVATGSGSGAHLYFQCEQLPATTRVHGEYGNIELRANGCYVIAPPSVHPNGNHYSVAEAQPVKRVPDMAEIVKWIKAGIAEKHGGTMPVANTAKPQNYNRWAQAALNAECRAVQFAPQGKGNNTLYRAALKLGQLVAQGLLGYGEVESSLINAAAGLSARDGETATIKTIHSGMAWGMEYSDRTKRK